MFKTHLKSAIYLLFLIYVYISVFSYNYKDPSLNTITNEEVTNLGGIVGSYLADILIQFFGLASVTIVTTIIYFLIIRPPKLLLKIFYLVLINLGLCAILAELLLNITARYMHGGIIGDALINNYQFIFALTLIGINGLVGWNKVICFIFFLCKKTTSFFASILFFEFYNRTNKNFGDEIYKQQLEKIEKTERTFKSSNSFEFPSICLLSKAKKSLLIKQLNNIENNKNLSLLKQVLNDFDVRGEIINVCYGPVVTLYKLKLQAGMKSAKVICLSDDIARSMSVFSARISIIRGQNAIGIELPNKEREIVMLRDLFESPEYQDLSLDLPIALGREINGKSFIVDLAKMPHLLIAGTTGSGKSVAINTMILSLVYRLNPDKCKMVMIDPKMLELSIYDKIPHLITPVVTESKRAVIVLKWMVKEMENRYRIMSCLNVRNIISYNQKVIEKSGKRLKHVVQIGSDLISNRCLSEGLSIKMKTLPYIVVVIDEIADLMLIAGREIEHVIQRLTQMARAAGIHIIMATQRPSVDIITGVIKANFPTRISFAVASKIDSRIILGEHGAEQLLGMGDMLYVTPGSKITRVHGSFVSDIEVRDIVYHLKMQGNPDYIEEITRESFSAGSTENEEKNDLYKQAVAIIQSNKKVSISYIQRRLRIGYNKAANIIERMEKEGIVSTPNLSGKREILIK
ncbi:MAG: DNA translocase FtsK 4TM domain-containing protein [Wolbachia endosymbiont of Menacanthus eurysternus]|nr:MAG: DNA translocase FtsK 4TM domain-containing protein [Wolbachia endosymbiont of Menacanthus eurysternus]